MSDVVSEVPADLWVTQTGAVNTSQTCTLPAPPAGQNHYICRIELIKLYAVAGVASAAGVIVTTTNLPGNPAFTTEQSVNTVGTAKQVIIVNADPPVKSLTAGTATTFVAPAQAQTIWRWNVSYYNR